ncbi:hypothetical protein Tco_0940922 [Tanacetum coccineum]|uniref:Uncharacterized protein n=1 Tax=Tanacetum coccineum TaxID=301880 RepID=A0ABQ5DRN3_9ASTR
MTARISIRDEPSIFLLGKSHEVGESSTADAARQDRLAIARDDPYSIAREDLYGFVDMVDVPPRCSMSRELDYDITDAWDDLGGDYHHVGIIEDAQDDLLNERLIHPVVIGIRIGQFIIVLSVMSALISGYSQQSTETEGGIAVSCYINHKRQVQLTKTLRLLKGQRHSMVSRFHRQHGPAKGPAQPDAPERLVEFLDLVMVVAMLCSLYDLPMYNILSVTGISRLVWL